eukprot:3295325-Pleurochrysis_carterae.AAC.7
MLSCATRHMADHADGGQQGGGSAFEAKRSSRRRWLSGAGQGLHGGVCTTMRALSGCARRLFRGTCAHARANMQSVRPCVRARASTLGQSKWMGK